MSNEKITIKDSDLGVWFGIDHNAIHNQPQLDLAVVALAECYGFMLVPMPLMQSIHNAVHAMSENDLDEELVEFLIVLSELAFQFLALKLPAGYEFKFIGEDYSQLELQKV